MGTMVQRLGLDEVGYRGALLANHPQDVRGDPDLLSLTAWSLVHGLSALLSSGAIPVPPTAAAERELVLATLRLLGQGISNPHT